MILQQREFFNGAQRSAQLQRKGNVMFMNPVATPMRVGNRHLNMTGNRAVNLKRSPDINGLGETATTTWSEDLFSLVKTALPIYQQQQVFNQQLKVAQATGTPVAINAAGQAVVATPTNWGRIAMLGGAGVLGVMLLKSVMSRR